MQILTSAALAVLLASAKGQQPTGSTSKWNANFMEEFTSGTIGSNWMRTLGDWKGTAPGAFVDANSVILNGQLLLKTTYADGFTPAGLDEDCDCGFENIQTSMVASKKMYKYGFFEVRAKASSSTLLNSFWLQGEHSEINVMELITGSETRQLSSNIHCWDDTAADTAEAAYPAVEDPTDWHTYGVEWSASTIKFFVDGKLHRTLAKSAISKTRPQCMDEPMNIILSTETNKDAGIPAKFTGSKVFRVGYVRHWDSIVTTTAATTPTTPEGGMPRKTCTDLGWKVSAKAKKGFDNVCAAKFSLFSKCSHLKKETSKRTFAAANEQCSAIGARLCTSTELSKNVGVAIGCNFQLKRYTFVSDSTCADGQVMTAFGRYKKSKQPECVPAETKLHVRCCSDVDLLPKTGEAAKAEPMIGGAMDTSDGSISNADDSAGASASTIATGFGVAIVLVAAVVAIAVAARTKTPGDLAAAARDAEARGQRRASFDDCIDAVSQAGSLASLESVEVVPSYMHDASEPDAFEENGFVLDQEGASLRIKSVRRGNPAFMNSVYSPEDTVGDATIDEISST